MKNILYGASAIALTLAGTQSLAATGSSNAYAAKAAISVASTLQANATLNPVSGSLPPSYSQTSTIGATSDTAVLAPGAISVQNELSVDATTTNAFSSGSPGTSVTGSANITNASNSLFTSALGIPTLGLQFGADVITSTTTAGVDAGGLLYSTGSATIANLNLSGSILAGLGIDVGLFANAAPNTVLLSLPGLSLTLNEQLLQSTITSLHRQTNAIHLALNDYAFGGSLLTGDVIIGHSEAEFASLAAGAVPEPASWATLFCGFGLLGATLRSARHRRTNNPQSALAT